MGSALAYHQMKHKSEAVNPVGYHNEREEEEDEEKRTNHSNKNIDNEKTGDNIFLKKSSGSYHKDIKEIVKSRTDKPIRKNAVMMVGHTIQFGGDVAKLPEEEQVEILKRGYDFISERYGEGNVISATIHRDETNPHLHVDMVPMTEDGRLCARDVVTRRELRSVQADLLEFMQEEYPELGFDRLSEEERAFSNGQSQEDYERLIKESNRQKEVEVVRDNLNRGKVRKLDEREEKLDSREGKLDDRESLIDKRENSTNKRVNDVNRVTVKQRQKAIEQGETEEKQSKKEEELSKIEIQLNEKATSLSNKEESLEVVKRGLSSKGEYLKLKEQEIDKKTENLTENLNRMIENANIPEIRDRLLEIDEEKPLGEEAAERLILTNGDLDGLIENDNMKL